MFKIKIGKYSLIAERTGEYAIEVPDMAHPIHTGRAKSLRKAQEAGLEYIQVLLDGLRGNINADLTRVKVLIKEHKVASKELAKLQKQLKREEEKARRKKR